MSLIRAQEMELVLHTLIVLELSWIANSFNIYEPAKVPGWTYFGYSWMDQKPSFVFRKPMAAMVDLTNDLGVAILQDYSYSRSNFAFSPYGVASVLVVLYEGARGESARQIHRAVKFPWDKDITRIGFRDIHRHLRSYFSHEGYLSGITLSKEGSSLKSEYKQILRFYGYDVDVDTPERTSEAPLTTTAITGSSAGPTTNSTTTGSEVTTTEGYDVTTGKDLEETNIAESSVEPEPITTSSPVESMTITTMAEVKEPVTVAGSSTVTEMTEGLTSATEKQNSGIGPEQNTQDSQPDTKGTTPQGTDQNSEQVTQQNTEESNQGDAETDTQQNTEVNTVSSSPASNEQGAEHSTQQNTDESTQGSDVPDGKSTEGSVGAEQSTQQYDEQNTQKDVEQSTQGDTHGEEGSLTSTEPIAEQVDEQTVQNSSPNIPEASMTDTPLDNEAETEQSAGESNDDAQPSTEDAEPGSQQNTEETTAEDNQQNAEPGTEMSPMVTPTEEVSEPLMEPMTTKPTTAERETEETTTSTDEVEQFTISTPANMEEMLATLQEAEVIGNLTTEEGDRSSRSGALDNGMLIPQYTNGRYSYFDDRLGLAYSNPEKRNLIDDSVKHGSTSEDWKEIGVVLIAEGDEVKWEPKTLDAFLTNLMKSAGEGGDDMNRDQRLYSGKTGRRKRHQLVSTTDSTVETLLMGGGRTSRGSSTGKSLPVGVETSAKLKRRHSTKEKRNISEFLKVPPVTDLSLQLQNGMFDSHVSKDTDLYRVLPKFLFLVDGAIDTPVPMMTYTNIFPFAYIPRLHCKALEFPLDDERYKLLILLPVERRGLRQLIYDLGSYTLREVIDVLRPARVKAMVPTFMVEGFVILTPTLQKMGIWDVFDPRRSDLSGMTSDPDLYVRNIEQSVTVVIRNYVEILDIQTRTMAARHIDEDFTASHPFLYFVMDTATNVALMAGQMLDPLNSRIY